MLLCELLLARLCFVYMEVFAVAAGPDAALAPTSLGIYWRLGFLSFDSRDVQASEVIVSL